MILHGSFNSVMTYWGMLFPMSDMCCYKSWEWQILLLLLFVWNRIQLASHGLAVTLLNNMDG